MGTCVTNVPPEKRDVKCKANSYILANEHSSSDNDDNNLALVTFSSVNDRKIANYQSLGDIAYEASTQTETRSSWDERRTRYTESDHSNKITQAVASSHCCWTIGNNRNGAQGNGTKHNVTQLTKMTTLPKDILINNIVTGNCGSAYLLCSDNKKLIVYGHNIYGSISMDNEVICSVINVWNSYNSLGKHILNLLISFSGSLSALKQPLKPCYIYNKPFEWLSLGIASFHKFLLSTNGDLFAIGKNGWNQCGMKFNDHHYRNTTHCIKIDYFQRRRTTLKQIACALTYSIFLDENGKLYSCGKSIHGGLGLGATESYTETIQALVTCAYRITAIVCGESHCVALDEINNVLSWGCSSYGQLGHSDTKSVFRPRLIKYLSKNDIKITQIASGANHNLLLDNKANLYCFGRNDSFQCGTGINEHNVTTPQINDTMRNINVIGIKCGFEHNVIKCENHDYYLWGKNEFNQCLVCKQDQHFVKLPTKYKGTIDGISDWLEYKIVDIYPGWKETRIVTTKVKRTSYM